MPNSIFRWSSGAFSKAKRLTSPDLPLEHRLRLWRNGFRSWSSHVYELERNDMRDYLPDSAMKAMQALNGEVGKSIFRNKLLFSHFFKDHFATPPILGWLDRGKVFTSRGREASFETFSAWVGERPGGVILRPFAGAEGMGIFRVVAADAGWVVNKETLDPVRFRAAVGSLRNYLVTPFVEQASYAKAIFPGSANTLRIITMQHAPDAPFIPVATHRFGTEQSAPADNSARGGVSAPVDIETGRLGTGYKFPSATGKRWPPYPRHPDTGALIEGVVVPRWPDIRDHLLGVVKQLPFLRYVGWDVVVTEDGYCVIEGNSGASLHVQVFHPFLKDERVRAFLKAVEVL